jgi:hypothetical protein
VKLDQTNSFIHKRATGAGIALTFGKQLIPPGDKGVKEVITVVEKEVYAMARVA